MSLGDHLEELRYRILLSIAVPLPLSIAFFAISDMLVRWLVRPLWMVLAHHGLPPDVQVLSPPETLMTKLKLSFLAAFVVSVPWVVYHAWKFVAPGLYRQEQRFVHLLLPGSALLTLSGVALLYYVMLPLMLHVLVMIGSGITIDAPPRKLGDAEQRAAVVLAETEQIPLRARAPEVLAPGDAWVRVPEMRLEVVVPERADAPEGPLRIVEVLPEREGRIDQTFRLSFVIDFVLLLMVAMVVAFQMPLVIMLLGWLGLVPLAVLTRNRRYAVGLCAVLAAILTPADIFSMLMLLVPLYALYELGILLLRIAPADRVREGTVLRSMVPAFLGRGDKTPVGRGHAERSAQIDGRVARSRRDEESQDRENDEESSR